MEKVKVDGEIAPVCTTITIPAGSEKFAVPRFPAMLCHSVVASPGYLVPFTVSLSLGDQTYLIESHCNVAKLWKHDELSAASRGSTKMHESFESSQGGAVLTKFDVSILVKEPLPAPIQFSFHGQNVIYVSGWQTGYLWV